MSAVQFDPYSMLMWANCFNRQGLGVAGDGEGSFRPSKVIDNVAQDWHCILTGDPASPAKQMKN